MSDQQLQKSPDGYQQNPDGYADAIATIAVIAIAVGTVVFWLSSM